MKLLLDENLSRRVIPFLQDAFPGSSQVALLNLGNVDDRTIWDFAKDQEFVIVTKDADFYDMSIVYGQPPKIIWLKIGNQSKAVTVNALVSNREVIELELIVEGKACIEIYR